jgi:undecaprenyl diphosphate synthase
LHGHAIAHRGRLLLAAFAARKLPAHGAENGTDRARFVEHLAEVDHCIAAPDVDLLIRTGGEKRLSDFLLWECAYAELHFVECFWPDFDAAAFAQAIAEYGKRDRRFGQVSASGANGVRTASRA